MPGLLPNYAFPETGVKLRVIVTGLEAAEKSDKGYQVQGLPAAGAAGDPRVGAVQHLLRRRPQAAH